MTSSPRFWQKFGLGKQHRSSSTSTANSDTISIHSSFYHGDDSPVSENYIKEKQVKRVSASSLKHKSSTVSLYRKSSVMAEKLPRRASSVNPLKRADQVETTTKFNGNRTTDVLTKLPSRKQSDTTKTASKLTKTKSNQSLVSVSTTTSIGSSGGGGGGGRSSVDGKPTTKLRQPSTKSNSSKKKFGNSSGEEEDNKPALGRSSSSGSTTSEKKGRKSVNSRRKDEDAAYNLLRDELEMEKSSALALKGQKEAIAKDLDYFCSMVDELTEEKEELKRKYEEEVNDNKSLRKAINDLETRMLSVGSNNSSGPTVENLQQQIVQERYVYYNNTQLKNNEISKLKADLKQAQNQIQVLRNTMQQLLKSENDLLNSEFHCEDKTMIEEKDILLKSHYFLDQFPGDTVVLDEDDHLSATSKDSSHSHKSRAHSVRSKTNFY